MLAEHVHVVETVREQVAAPISGGKVVGNDLAVEALGLPGAGHRVRHRSGCDQLDTSDQPSASPWQTCCASVPTAQRA